MNKFRIDSKQLIHDLYERYYHLKSKPEVDDETPQPTTKREKLEAMKKKLKPGKKYRIRYIGGNEHVNLQAKDAELKVKYKHYVPGSVTKSASKPKFEAEIRCVHPSCKNTRRVYTSDIFQVLKCEKHKKR